MHTTQLGAIYTQVNWVAHWLSHSHSLGGGGTAASRHIALDHPLGVNETGLGLLHGGGFGARLPDVFELLLHWIKKLD